MFSKCHWSCFALLLRDLDNWARKKAGSDLRVSDRVLVPKTAVPRRSVLDPMQVLAGQFAWIRLIWGWRCAGQTLPRQVK